MNLSNIHIIDTTLREGLQNSEAKIIVGKEKEYVSLVDRLGVCRIEFAHPHSRKENEKILKEISELGLGITISLHSRLLQEHIELITQSYDPNYFQVSTFFTSKMFDAILAEEKQSDIEKTLLLIRESGFKYRLGIEDAFTYSPKEIARVIDYISKIHPPEYVGFSDTGGKLTPIELRMFLREVYMYIPPEISIEFHFHNDYGLAAANLFSCITSASLSNRHIYFSASYLGLGERVGITSLADCLVQLLLVFGREELLKYYNPKEYLRLHTLTGIDSSSRDPLSANAFHHTASSHLENIDSDIYNPIPASLMGTRPNLLFGESTSSEAYHIYIRNRFDTNLQLNDAKNVKKVVIEFTRKNNKLYLTSEELEAHIIGPHFPNFL